MSSIVDPRCSRMRLICLLAFGMAAAWASPPLTLNVPAETIASGGGCERSFSRRLAFSNHSATDVLQVQASGSTCSHARIATTLRSSSGRLLWSETSYLSEVEFGADPDEQLPQQITLEYVEHEIETWVTIEVTSDAPDWPAGALGLAPSDLTQYESQLDRARYLRIRAVREPMLCVPIGPESGHCIAIDPATQRAVEFFSRGI